MNPFGQTLLKSLGRSLLAGGILLASTGVLPAAAAPGIPSSPSRVNLPASPAKVIGTPTLPSANPQVTTPAASVGKLVASPTPNPRVSLPAGSLPKARIPLPPHVAAATDDSERQVLVFSVDATGVLKSVIKQPDSTLDPTAGEPDGFWGAAFGLSGAIFPPGASLAAVYHPTNKAIDVFGVDNDGALKDVRREKLTFGTPFWQPPVPLTSPGFAEPGAPVAAVWQPLNDQLEVYVVSTNGAVMGVWNENNGPWKPAFSLTDAGFAPRFSEIAAAWPPSSEMLEVFVADNSGSLKGIWKLHDRAWGTPESITGSGFMSAGGPVAAVWEPSNTTLDVFTVDQNGTAKLTSKHHISAVPLPAMPWEPARALFDNVALQRNSLLTATWSEVRDAPVVSVVDSAGAVRETYAFRGNWQGAYEPITNAGFAPAGASLASTSLPIRTINGSLGDNPNNLKSVAVFGVDPSKAIRQVTVDKAGTPLTRPNYNPIYGSHAAYCSDVLRHYSSVTSESSYKDCVDFMGLTKYCADQGAHVMVDYRGNKAILNCQLDYHQDSWLWQYGEEARWIANAAHDAFVAVVPMLELAGETTGCAALVIFACVSLAVDVAGHVDQLAGGADVADSVLSVKDCAEDDILACAKLGQKGIDAAAGVTIPGEDPASVDGDAARCRNGEFQACMRLGEQAAGAGGMPFDSQSRQEADACSNGDFNACISLGKHAADLGVPLGGVPNAADNLNACKVGDIAACSQLGQALASVPR